MYKRNQNQNSRFGRNKFTNRRRPAGGNSRRGGFKGKYIDPNRFINKANSEVKEVPYVPKCNFLDFNIDSEIKKNITACNYITPTPIQDESIPHILKGRDMVGIANTGTGKTAAFLLPLMDKVLKNPNTNVLVITPTRELTQQINSEFIKFRGRLKMFSVCCVGGVSIGAQIGNLKRRHNFVFGTPGRLKDLVERKIIDLSKFETIVLDEADRMLDMGFVPDMRFVMGQMPKNRQTLFFSATTTPAINKLIEEFLTDSVTISVKTGDTSKNVDQDIIRIKGGDDKTEVLYGLLSKAEFSKVLVFGRTKFGVDKLSKSLAGRGVKSESIHGNKNQNRRQKSLQAFKSGEVDILIATDVAARGLDIPLVSHVINYDVPDTYEDYVHRIGRTGRAGQKGKALTFIE